MAELTVRQGWPREEPEVTLHRVFPKDSRERSIRLDLEIRSRWLHASQEFERADRDLDRILGELKFLRSHVSELRHAFEFAKELRSKIESGRYILVETQTGQGFEFSLPEGMTTEDLEKCKAAILEELEKEPGFYPSDFAAKHGLDLRLVLRAFSDLERTGEIELAEPPKK